MRRAILILGFLPLAALAAAPATPRAAYLHRAQVVATWRAAQPDQPGFEKVSDNTRLAVVAARLRLGLEPAWCTRTVVELMRQPAGDMFWMFQCAAVSHLGRDRLGAEAHAAIREAWRTYFPLRGDTENHWLMYYASLYLMAQQWPGEPGVQWFNGKSSAENQAEARGWLERWCEVTTTVGQGEYDCTHYLGEYATALVMLAAWAEDPAMRQRARMMLDCLFADFAVESLDGLYVGAHARTDEVAVLEKWACFATYFSWLLFAQGPTPAEFSRNGWGWGTYFALLAENYEVPEVIRQIATDRSQPYLHRELKRPRHRWRHNGGPPEPVYKTTYMSRDYAVGSDQGGLHQPLQQHAWDVTWAVPDPRGVHNTLLAVQPFCSAEALQAFYTDYPEGMPERVALQGKPSYPLEDKLLGGSPYEQVFQQDDTIVSLTCVPATARYGHINGFFSKDLAVVEEDPSGWIFARGGRAFIAYRPLAPGEWLPYARYKSVWTGEREAVGDRRLRSAARRNGTIVQVAGVGEFADFAGFKAAVRALPLSYQLEPAPAVQFTTLRGRRLVCTFGKLPVVDGVPVDYAAWQLFDGPFLHAARDSRMLTLTHGRLERVLDFHTLTITDRVRP